MVFQIKMNLHGFGWVDVLLFHEPARLVSTDGQQRDVKPAALSGCLAAGKALLGVHKVLAVASVTAEVPVHVSAKHGPAAPQRLAAVTQTAG